MFALKKQQLKEQVRQPYPAISFAEIADTFDIDLLNIVHAKAIMNIVKHENITDKSWIVDDDNEPLFEYLLKHDQRFVFENLCNLNVMRYISFNGIDLFGMFVDQVIEMKEGIDVFEELSDTSIPAELRCDALIKAYNILNDKKMYRYISVFRWYCMKIIHTILPTVSMDEIHYFFHNNYDSYNYDDDCIMSPTLAKRLGERLGCDVNVNVFEKDFDPNIPLRCAVPKNEQIDGLRFGLMDIFYDNIMLLLLTRDDQEAAVTEYLQRNSDVINQSFKKCSKVFPKKIRRIFEQTIPSPSFTNRIGTLRTWDTDMNALVDLDENNMNNIGKEWLRTVRRVEMINTIDEMLFMDKHPLREDDSVREVAIRAMNELINGAMRKIMGISSDDELIDV